VGYEVLDGGGATSAVTDRGRGQIEVVALEDLPHPDVDRGPRRPPRFPPWLVTTLRQVTPALAVAFAVAVLAGVAAGAWVAHRRAAAADEASARNAASAFAIVAGIDSYASGTGQVADVTLRLFNVGARPITVATSDPGADPSRTAPVVRLINGDGTLLPGRDALVRAVVALDCDSAGPFQITVAVRSQDGTLHDVAVRDDEHVGLTRSASAMCSRDDYADPLPVRLTGSLRSPSLQLSNTTDRPLTISLDSGSPLTQAASEYLAVTTLPALPLVMAPNSEQHLSLRLTVQGCHRDLGPLQDGGSGYLGLRIEGSPDGPVQTGVDVSALVGAALERSCR
jgi:hypothetical protein